MDTSHVSVLDEEESVELAVVVKHLALHKRPVDGAFRSEATDNEEWDLAPHRPVPESARLRRSAGLGNGMAMVAQVKPHLFPQIKHRTFPEESY